MVARNRSARGSVRFVPTLRASSDVFWRALWMACLTAPALAQESTGQGGTAAAATAAPAVQEATLDQMEGASAPVRHAWSVVPRISIKETYSDNTNLSGANPQSDWITDIAPGITVAGQTRRLKAHFAYDVHQLFYAQGSHNNQTQQSLNAFGTLEAVDKFLFVDMNGTITQQRISAFGSQSAAAYSVNNNSTETSTYRFSPYVKGQFGGYVDYTGRYTRTAMRSKSSAASDFDSDDWIATLSGDTPLTMLGWSADAEQQRYGYHPGRSNSSDRFRGFGYLRITPELRLSFSGGRERNDFLSTQMESYSTHGAGVDWRPNERTEVSLFKEKRFFGDGHKISISQRVQHSSFKFTDSRDVAVLPSQSGVVGLGTFYDLLFAQLASTFPDEATRAAHVNALLTTFGIPPDAVVTANFLSSQATLQRRQELAYILTGVRNVLTIALVRSHDERLGSFVLTGLSSDFQNNSSIDQRGVNVGWGHKLSALSSLNVMASQSRSRNAANDVGLETTQKTLSSSISTRLGSRTQGSLMLRRTVFSSSTAPYTENALTGTISVEF